MNDSNAAVIEALRTHYLFSGLSEAELGMLQSSIRLRKFAAGQSLFDQGDPAHEFFLLRQGAVKLYRVSAAGQEKIMRLIQPGQSFAESVMFMDDPRYLVHAQGLEAGTLVTIASAAYLNVMRASFDTCRAVFARMTERIQAHWDEIELLTLQNSRYRVVQYLLGLYSEAPNERHAIALPVRKSLVAAHLGITPETLSRILHTLEEKILIRMQGYHIEIPDLAALRRKLEG
jgi:CRP-like cAMP-binding protein